MTANGLIPNFDAQSGPWEENRELLHVYLKKVKEAINARTIGNYPSIEVFSGNTFLSKSNLGSGASIFRKVIDVASTLQSLPGTRSANHDISVDGNFTLVHLYGAATNPSTQFIPLPYVDSGTPANGIQVYLDATQYYLVSSGNYGAYTRAYLVVEYVKQQI